MRAIFNFTISLTVSITVLAVVTVLSNVAYTQPRQSILFQKERVIISITTGRVLIQGEYTFANMSSLPRSVRLFYPFPVDSLHPFPPNISVSSGDKRIPFRTAGDGIYFAVKLLAQSSANIDISYEQRCLIPNACYILKSTAYWQTPLEEADFEIRIPTGIELKSMSYAADEVLKNGDTLVCSFTRKNFMPVRDLCLEWDNKKRDTK
jgi:hypothetical protein